MSKTAESASERVLRVVGRRLYLARWARCFLWSLAGLSVLAALAMPLFWLVEGTGWRMTLAVVPGVFVLAIALAFVLARRPDAAESARAADRAIDGKDLFLTWARLRDASGSAGEFAPLVIRDAEAAAKRVDPRRAVSIPLERPLGWAAGGIVLAVAVALLVPQFDPFGTEAAAAELAQEKKLQEELDKKTDERLKALRKKNPAAELSAEVKQSIEEFKKSLKRMRPNEQRKNRERLAEKQKELGIKWRLKSAKALKDSLDRQSSDQQFGRKINGEELRKWEKELQQGSTKSLRKEIDDLQQELQKLAKMTDPIKRQEKMREIEERLKTLDRSAKNVAGSKPLAASLKRAMQQMDAARKAGASPAEQKEIAKQALESMQESLKLSKLELEEIAQSARDLKKLEEALKTLQMAKKANSEKGLDGKACENCMTMEDYQEIYQELIAQLGEGSGMGMGNRGFGEGGEAPEDKTAKTGFTPEQSKSAITAGKILLSLKTKGLTDSGEAEQNYAQQVKQVKQGVSEAILQEQVPPGYHEEIKEYFDTLKEKD